MLNASVPRVVGNFRCAKWSAKRRCERGLIAGRVRAILRQTRMHLATVLRYFEQFRREVAWESEEMYRAHAHDVSEYDEYFYLPSGLKPADNVDKIRHFLTLA